MSTLSRVGSSAATRTPAPDPSLLPKSGMVPLPVDPVGTPAFADSIRRAIKDDSQPSRQPAAAGSYASGKNKCQVEPTMLPVPGNIAGSSPATTSSEVLKCSSYALPQPSTMSPATSNVGAVTESLALLANIGGEFGAASATPAAGTSGSTGMNSASREKTAGNAASTAQNGTKAADISTPPVAPSAAAIVLLPISPAPAVATLVSGALTLTPVSQSAGDTVVDGESMKRDLTLETAGTILQQPYLVSDVSASPRGQAPSILAGDGHELPLNTARAESAGIGGSAVGAQHHATPDPGVMMPTKAADGARMGRYGTSGVPGSPEFSGATGDSSGLGTTTEFSTNALGQNVTVSNTNSTLTSVDGSSVSNATHSISGTTPLSGASAVEKNPPLPGTMAGTPPANIPAPSSDSSGGAATSDHAGIAPGPHPFGDLLISGVGSMENHFSNSIGGTGTTGFTAGNLSNSNAQASARFAPSDAFAALDHAASADPNRLLHLSPNQVAVGVADPHLGWVEVRAERAAGQVSAQISAGSAATHAELTASLPAMTAYLHEQRVGIQTLAVTAQLSGGSSSGTAEGGSGNTPGRESSQDIAEVGATSQARATLSGISSLPGRVSVEHNSPSGMVELRHGHQVSVRA